MIEWEDSCQPVAAWRHLSGMEPLETILCHSVGWLLFNNAKSKTLAPNMGCVNEVAGLNLEASGVITIPTRSVRRIVKLREPR